MSRISHLTLAVNPSLDEQIEARDWWLNPRIPSRIPDWQILKTTYPLSNTSRFERIHPEGGVDCPVFKVEGDTLFVAGFCFGRVENVFPCGSTSSEPSNVLDHELGFVGVILIITEVYPDAVEIRDLSYDHAALFVLSAGSMDA